MVFSPAAQLTPARRATLVTILSDLGQVAVASIALPFFLDTFRPLLAVVGCLLAIAFWYAALVFSR